MQESPADDGPPQPVDMLSTSAPHQDPLQANNPWQPTSRYRTKTPPPAGSFAVASSFIGEKTPGQEEVAVAFHQVKGKETWGLVFDPGAADGLAGTQTLLEYLQAVAWPAERDVSHAAAGRFSSYAGIDGKPLPAGPRSNVPFDFGPFEAEFSMDSIGKSGDKCPFLYSNRTCISQKNIFLASYYENGDALLIFPNLHNKSYGVACS